MSREARLKATAAGLQPQSLDLTKHAKARSVSRVQSMKVSPDNAAWAVAFLSAPIEVQGVVVSSPLSAAMIRLKYAEQERPAGQRAATRRPAIRPKNSLFWRALDILLHYHNGQGMTKDQVTLRAVAAAALFEWAHDSCPRCRSRRAIEQAELDRPGVRCLACNSTGRLSFRPKHRWKMVADYLSAEGVRAPRLDAFSHWMPKYHWFLDVLRRIDRQVGAGLDYGMEPSFRIDEAAAGRQE